MSRTIRRKNYKDTQNTSWDRQGRKLFGYYAEYDLVAGDRDRCGYKRVYREPTARELHKAKLFAHGESRSSSDRSPSRWYRGVREAEYRVFTRNEINRFFRNSEYEPVISDKPVNCWWDWS